MTQAAVKDPRNSPGDDRVRPQSPNSHSGNPDTQFRGLIYPRLAADCGNRQIKYGRNSQEICIIPAYYKNLLPYETPLASDGSIVVEYQEGVNESLKDQRWVVGKLARELNGIPTFEGEKSEVYARFALAAVDCPSPRNPAKAIPVRVEVLKVCIPDIQDTEKVEGIRQSLAGRHRYRRNGCLIDLQIHEVLIEAEGISAFEFLKAQKVFKWRERINGVIDAGGGNVTATLFSSSGHPIWDSRITLDGTKELALRISRDPILVGAETNGVSPRIEVILDAIATDKKYRGARKTVSIAKAYKEHLDAWLEDFKRKLNSKWNAYFAEFGQGAVIGGSAPLFAGMAAKSKGRIFVVKNNPAIVTARGMLLDSKSNTKNIKGKNTN